MKKLSILFFVLLVSFAAQCQEQSVFFEFAINKDSIINAAYFAKDAKTGQKNMDEFITKFNQLSPADKEKYESIIQGSYYNLACTYAITGDKKNALNYLEKSRFYDYQHLLEDHDMDRLRKEPRFIHFLSVAKKQKPKFQSILINAPKYNLSEKSTLPAFKYQSVSDPHLAALKKAFNLDSIAGKGNDISQIINLMEWVHYLVPHDGTKENPEVKNAMNLITECRRDKKTLNCRGLGILLNEIYLAEGFKSRFITCLPRDTSDQDCHVITMVWSESLKKWVWMDPTFMAYVMDEKGTLLSIEEVRERIINDKPLILNPDANWNRKNSQTKEYYLGNYMAKNLYKLECAASSEYNYETKEDGKQREYIALVPGNTTPAPQYQKDKHGVTSYSLYFTNNPRSFWAEPLIEKPTQADYEKYVGLLKKFYNEKNTDGIAGIYSGEFTAETLERITEKYGKIVSYKYIGRDQDDSNVALFKLVLEKSVIAFGLSIERDNKIGTFRFDTRSPYINDLLAKEGK